MYYTGQFLRICTANYGQGTCWPLVTNYPVIIPARQMSEVSVITPRLKSSSWGHRGWRDIKPKRSNVFLGHFFSKKRREKIFCCLLRSVRVRGSVPVHMVRTGCSYRTAVTVSRIEQMSPLKAFFFDTHGLYYHHEIKLKTCPFRHHNDRVILGRWAWTKCVQYCVLQNRSA